MTEQIKSKLLYETDSDSSDSSYGSESSDYQDTELDNVIDGVYDYKNEFLTMRARDNAKRSRSKSFTEIEISRADRRKVQEWNLPSK